MSTGKRFNEYVETVLRGIRFTEAHAEIRKELTGHLEEAKGLTSGLNLTEDEIEAQVIRRMGNPRELSQTFDKVHRPTVDGIILSMLGFLLAIGSFAMLQSNRLGLHLLWIGLGMPPLLALIFVKPSSVRERSWFIYGAAVVLGILATLFGQWHNGQPYLSLGLVNIKVVDLSVAIFILGLAGPISETSVGSLARKSFVCAAALIPLVVYAWIGSFFPAMLFMTACLSMMLASKQDKATLLGYSSIGVALTALSFGKGIFVSSENYSSVVANEKHTDFVFSYLSSGAPALAAITAVTAVMIIVYAFSASMSVKSLYGKTASTGAVAAIAVGVIWGLLSNLGFVPMPVSGVYFPFLSYSGSLMIAHMTLVGLILGIQRRRNLHFS